jgi:hypothetical protein
MNNYYEENKDFNEVIDISALSTVYKKIEEQ